MAFFGVGRQGSLWIVVPEKQVYKYLSIICFKVTNSIQFQYKVFFLQKLSILININENKKLTIRTCEYVALKQKKTWSAKMITLKIQNKYIILKQFS